MSASPPRPRPGPSWWCRECSFLRSSACVAGLAAAQQGPAGSGVSVKGGTDCQSETSHGQHQDITRHQLADRYHPTLDNIFTNQGWRWNICLLSHQPPTSFITGHQSLLHTGLNHLPTHLIIITWAVLTKTRPDGHQVCGPVWVTTRQSYLV